MDTKRCMDDLQKSPKIESKRSTNSEKRGRKRKDNDLPSTTIRSTTRATSTKVKKNDKATAETLINAASRRSTRVAAKRPITPAKSAAKTLAKSAAKTLAKSAAKTPAKSAAKTPSKAATKTQIRPTAKAKSKRPAVTAKVNKKGSNGTRTCSSERSYSNSPIKRTIKRKVDDIADPSPSANKRAKTMSTPGTTPRRKRDAPTKSIKKKNKTSTTIQFEYGVPSPTETEIEDDDSPSQLVAREAQRAVIAKTKKGQSIRISVEPPRTFVFKSEKARKLWETAVQERATLVKTVIDNRDYVPDWLKRQLEGSLEFTAPQKRSMLMEDKNRRVQGMLESLKLEEKALDLDAEIKSSLKKEFAETDIQKCIACLDKLLRLPFNPLTLKKYPQLAMTPCLLQKYKGALTRWTLSSQQEELFCSQREILWEKAKALQRKFMILFGIEDDAKYVDDFKERLQSFQDSVSNLTDDEISLLIHDPSAKRKIVKKRVSLTSTS